MILCNVQECNFLQVSIAADAYFKGGLIAPISGEVRQGSKYGKWTMSIFRPPNASATAETCGESEMLRNRVRRSQGRPALTASFGYF
ncbi:hypothetical protein [uncultured Bradyrhizobium sp.]|uniref:hypothetical protein n=1 Tax=uncultured Bradyrhizobium sp. TaxID=199684 RepID=UPI0035CBD37E